MKNALRVIKIGGSLLNGEAPAERLRSWLDKQSSGPFVLVVGGGELVETLRRLDSVQPIGDARAHWLAVDLMAINARVVAGWLDLPLVDGRLESLLEASQRGAGPRVYDVRRFLRDEESALPGPRLPIGWKTTSDAIAARVATALNASLTLCKSCHPPTAKTPKTNADWLRLAEAGYVDGAFPEVAAGVSEIDVAVPPA